MTFIKLSAMRKLATLALVLLTTGASGQTEKAPVVPGAYIVEFAGDAANAPAFYSNLSSNAIDATPRLTLSHELFNGASFVLEGTHDNDTTIETIHQMAVVSKIWPVRVYTTESTINSMGLGGLQRAASLQKRTAADTYSPHVMGSVDRLHAEGFTGEGVHVGVIDTGVDYNHPALGGGFGPGYKVVGGYDLVGDAYNGSNTPIPDSDPMDCNGHGTHVSGIIGATDNPLNFTGVAPNATLSMWRVFGCNGGASNDVLIQAFNMAYEAGVDVISASIGSESGWVEEIWDVAVQRIVEKGTPCILAGGNDGADGMFATSGAGEAIGAISVGSVNNIDMPSLLVVANYHTNVNATETAFAYAQGNIGDFGNVSLPLYTPTLDPDAVVDDCNPFPTGTPDLSAFVVLIKLGDCSFDTPARSAMALGAKNVLFYNNVASTPIKPAGRYLGIPVGMVSEAQGADWLSQLKAGRNITVDFITVNDAPLVLFDDPNTSTGGMIGAGGFMSIYTSWGPSFEGWLKPQVSAPGGLIVSTWPLALGGYAIDSGTSMATPFITGVTALIQQVRGQRTAPVELAALLASSATPLKWNDGTSTSNFLAPVIQQGGGLVNAYKAAHIQTLVDVDNIALNDTSNFQAVHPITISNIGSESITYNFANILAATAYTAHAGSLEPAAFPPDLNATVESGATIRFDPSSLTIGPKGTGQVVMHFTAPQGLDESRIPVYSGYVQVNGSNGDALSVPYGGIASRLKNATIVETRAGFPAFAAVTATSSQTMTPLQNFTLPGKAATLPDTILPGVTYSLAMGTRILRIDIVPENLDGVPFIIGEQSIGSIAGLPLEYLPREEFTINTWDGRLADDTWAPEGSYKFLFRALRILGAVDDDNDYERYESGFFHIEYQVQP